MLASSDGLPSLDRDPQFYMEPLFVKVQNTLFQIPRIAFERRAAPGSFFANVASRGLQKTQQDSEAQEGESAVKPIVLHVNVEDFRGLLHVLYAKSAIIPDYPSEINSSQWTGALRLSTIWKFKDIRQAAIAALESTILTCLPLYTISLARECKVRKWLIHGYQQLVLGSIDALKPDQTCGEALGYQTMSRLLYIRDKYKVSWKGKVLADYLNSDKDTGVNVYCAHCRVNRLIGTPTACNAFQLVSNNSGNYPVSQRVTDAIEEIFADELSLME